jgi:hypothetical protein
MQGSRPGVISPNCKNVHDGLTIETAGFLLPLDAFRFAFLRLSSGAYSSACSK